MNDDRARKLAQLEQAYESGILDEDTYRSALAALGLQAEAKLEGSGAIAQGPGAIAGGAGSLIIVNGRYEGATPKDAADARRIYLGVLANLVSKLPLRAFDASQSKAGGARTELSLINIYTALDTTATTVEPEEDKDAGAKEARDARQSTERDFLRERDKTRPLRALEAAFRHRRMVLLGEPGSGKSTFGNHLLFCLATRRAEPNAPWLEDFKRDWSGPPADALPIRVILRDFDAWLRGQNAIRGKANPTHLCEFIAAQLREQNLSFTMSLIDEALEKGKAYVLLDGLDEITSVRHREFARDAILALVERYPKSNSYLVTCRTWSYQPPEDERQPDLRLPESQFITFQLAQFDDEKIDQFIDAWHHELVQASKLTQAKANILQPKLAEAVRKRDLRWLAGNPLQLTLMAWVHTDDEELPDKRAKLYQRAIELLLWKWESEKRTDEATLKDFVGQIGDGKSQIERVLCQVAFEAHIQLTPQDQLDNPEKLADVSEPRLKKMLAALKRDTGDNEGKPDENWARDVCEAIKLRSGLLAQRLPDTLTFPHRTFQEYLAGAWLLQNDFVTQANEKASQLDVWREVILLAVGNSVYVKNDWELSKPLDLLRRLCPKQATDDEIAWKKAWLAGDVLAEIGVERASDRDADKDLIPRVRDRLIQLITGSKLTPAERVATGNTLARIGDSRFHPDAWYLQDEEMLGFVRIPAGPFHMGTRNVDRKRVAKVIGYEVYDDEINDQLIAVGEFYIARYPVTVAQFKAFVRDPSYTPGVEHSLGGVGVDTHPVVYVTWHDAMAYCNWLTDKLKMWSNTPEPLRTLLREKGWVVMLPSEAEWEKAARGDSDARIFAWGDEPDPNKANYADTDINTTSPVGCFPLGESPYHCRDMIGNVWEWTRSIHKPYPYTSKDGRENLKAGDEDSRVLRGGAFYYDHRNARVACRYRNRPGYRDDNLGFRVGCPRFLFRTLCSENSGRCYSEVLNSRGSPEGDTPSGGKIYLWPGGNDDSRRNAHLCPHVRLFDLAAADHQSLPARPSPYLHAASAGRGLRFARATGGSQSAQG